MYGQCLKRVIDIILSGLGLICLSWLFLILIIAIKIDDPGPAFFTQKRVGRGKTYFLLHKFRSMKMCTPHDIPTHLLENPEQYITRMGKLLELPLSKSFPHKAWNNSSCGIKRYRFNTRYMIRRIESLFTFTSESVPWLVVIFRLPNAWTCTSNSVIGVSLALARSSSLIRFTSLSSDTIT